MKKITAILLLLSILALSFVSCANDETDQGLTTTTAATTTAPCAEHTFGDWATEKPTCGTDGLRYRSCSVCGFKEEIVVPMTGLHRYSGAICSVCKMERIMINSVGLSNFVIVAASDDYSIAAANELKEAFKDFRYDISVRSEADAESEYEIVVGDVDRAASSAYYDQNADMRAGYCFFAVVGKKIVFCADEAKTMEQGVEGFVERYLESKSEISLSDSDFFTVNGLGIFGRVESSDVRIVSNNVLYDYTDARGELLLQSFASISADVLLLQEYQLHAQMDAKLRQLGYTEVPTSTDVVTNATEEKNIVPIWYDAGAVTLMDYGYRRYWPMDDMIFYSFTWAMFEQNSTGKQFITVSTHFFYGDEAYRVREANTLVAFVNELREEYGNTPIIVMGDFNANKEKEPVKIILQEMDCVRDSERLKYENDTDQGTFHVLGSYPGNDSSNIIDHTFITGEGYTLNQYQHVVNELTVKATDHIPLILDINFTH